MTNRQNAHGLILLAELVDDPISADTERPKPSKAAPQRMTRFGVSLQQSQRLGHGVRQQPIEAENLHPGSADKLDPAQLPLTATLEVSTEIGKSHGLTSFGFLDALFDGVQRLRVRKDLGRLFQRLVLAYRNQHSCRPTSTSHDDVLAQVGDLVDHLA
jgi:hypothetical protein